MKTVVIQLTEEDEKVFTLLKQLTGKSEEELLKTALQKSYERLICSICKEFNLK